MTHSIMIKNATIVPMDQSASEPARTIRDGALVTQDNKILAVGKTADIVQQHKRPDLVIDASGKTVMPGFVNVHTHIMASFLRGLLEDIPDHFYHYALPLEDFLTEESAYRFSVLGAIEAAKFGVTCINDIYHYSEMTAKAVDEVGLRGVIAHKVFDAQLSKIKDDVYTRNEDMGRNRLKANVKLVEDWNGKADGRITCRIGTHASDTCSTQLLRAGRDEANRLRVGIHIHLAQSDKETAYIRRQFGKSPVEYLAGIDFLGPDVVAAHLIYASDSDLQIIRETGTNVAHCPSIYGKVCVFPRIESMYANGISLAIGTDWLSMDIWDSLRQAIGITRILTGKLIPTADKVLKMATIASARALQLDTSVGSLEPGKNADLIILSTRKAHLSPTRNVAQNLVYYANGGDVDTVLVDGKIVVEHGELKTMDERKCIEEAQEAAEEVWSKVPYPNLVRTEDMRKLKI